MIIKIVFALLLPFLLGLFILAAVLKHKLVHFAFWERLALAFLFGSWLLSFIMFVLSFLKLPLDIYFIGLAGMLLLLCSAPFAIKHLKYYSLPKLLIKVDLFGCALLSLIVFKLLLTMFAALIKPMIAPDIIWSYAQVAKHIFIFKAPLFWGIKPPFPFFIESWPVLCIGQWNDSFLPLFYPLMLLSLLVIFYSSLRRDFKHLPSLFFSFLLISLPFLFYHAQTAYSDFPLAVFYPIATVYLFLFLKDYLVKRERSLVFLLTSLIFLGICIWIKKSGIYYAAINLLVLLVFLISKRVQIKRSDLRQIIISLCVFLSISLPWLTFQRMSTISYFHGQIAGSAQSAVTNPSANAIITSLTISGAMLRNMFLEGNWQLLWALFVALLIVYPRKAWQQPFMGLTSIIILNLAALFVVFGLSDWLKYIYDDSIINRLMLHFTPIVLFFCAEMTLSDKISR